MVVRSAKQKNLFLQYEILIKDPSTLMVCLLILILIYEYLLTAIGLSPGGSSTVHIYTQTIHRTTQLTTLVGRLSGIRTQSGQTIINDNDKLTAYNLSPNWQ